MSARQSTPSTLSLENQDEFPAQEVRQQLDNILHSAAFEATKAQKTFLRFVVERVLDDRANEIKGYTVATQVFGRGEDFDQATDPVVSIHANKLRRALERYYLLAGQEDPVRIDIPKGTYVPTFTKQIPVKADAAPVGAASAPGNAEAWPSVLILPFANMTREAEKSFLGIGVASDLAVEISRYLGINVLFPTEKHTIPDTSAGCRFVLQGSVLEMDSGVKITAHLTDTKSGRQIWGENYRSRLEDAEMLAFQERVVTAMAAKTAGICGAITKTMAIESRHKAPAELTIYEAILRYYEYDHNPTPESMPRALESLTHAAAAEPDCGQVWTALAHMYANIHGLALPEFEAPLEKAVAYAERGAHIDPDSQRALAILALARFHSDELVSAAGEAQRALELNPNSLLFMDGLGYILTLSGKWAAGTTVIRRAMRRNPLYRPLVHYALWLDCLHRQDHEAAYLETMNLKEPGIFWYPLTKAATLGLMGRTDEAQSYAQHLLDLKPDFPAHARMLIERFIKFEDLVERVLDGLRKAGLDPT